MSLDTIFNQVACGLLGEVSTPVGMGSVHVDFFLVFPFSHGCFSRAGVCRSLIESVLQEKYGDVERITLQGQVAYKLDLQIQLEEWVKRGLVPIVPPPTPGDLEHVQDFLFSPFVASQFQRNVGFRGHLMFLSIWADGGRAFPTQRGGDVKSIWAVMVIFFGSLSFSKITRRRPES